MKRIERREQKKSYMHNRELTLRHQGFGEYLLDGEVVYLAPGRSDPVN